MFKTA